MNCVQDDTAVSDAVIGVYGNGRVRGVIRHQQEFAVPVGKAFHGMPAFDHCDEYVSRLWDYPPINDEEIPILDIREHGLTSRLPDVGIQGVFEEKAVEIYSVFSVMLRRTWRPGLDRRFNVGDKDGFVVRDSTKVVRFHVEILAECQKYTPVYFYSPEGRVVKDLAVWQTRNDEITRKSKLLVFFGAEAN